jgi:hypothetical protein
LEVAVGLLDEAAEDSSDEIGIRLARGGGVAGCGFLLGEELLGAADLLAVEVAF